MSHTSPVAVFNDIPDTVEMLIQALRGAGLHAAVGATTQDGFDVAAFIREHDPSVVLFDINPPYAKSLEKFRRLRADAFPRLPVFLTTTDGHHLERWLEPGEVRGVFRKPCDVERLAEAIRQAMPAE